MTINIRMYRNDKYRIVNYERKWYIKVYNELKYDLF